MGDAAEAQLQFLQIVVSRPESQPLTSTIPTGSGQPGSGNEQPGSGNEQPGSRSEPCSGLVFIVRVRIAASRWIHRHAAELRRFLFGLALIGYFVYFGVAVNYSFEGSLALVVLTALALVLLTYKFVRDRWGKRVSQQLFRPIFRCWDNQWNKTKWLVFQVLCFHRVALISLSVTRVRKFSPFSRWRQGLVGDQNTNTH